MITLKTQQEIELMRQGGQILASVLFEVAKEVKPGVTTAHLNDLAEKLIAQQGALPAFKGFQGYPTALCTSVNEEIVHALPSERQLKQGDIIGLDLGILWPPSSAGHEPSLAWPPEQCGACPYSSGGCASQRGMFTDAALTIPVGKVSSEANRLIEVARGALNKAIETIKPGRKLSDVSGAIQKYVEKEGFSVIRDLVGHGIGYELHEAPEIPNFVGGKHQDTVLKEGMTLALEPMLSAGHHKVKKSKDGYGFETEDKSLTVHFEHTVAVTKNGCDVLTKI